MFITNEDVIKFKEEGVVIKKLFSEEQVEKLKKAVYDSFIPEYVKKEKKMANIQFLQPRNRVDALQEVAANKDILEACSKLLEGGEPVIGGASLFYGEKGIEYVQGWHRDLLHVPEDEIDDFWFTKGYHHNNVQINIALNHDENLWFIKGSHNREFTEEEKKIFGDSKVIADVKYKDLPNAEKVVLKPGEAAFYNNNALHKGYAGTLKSDRMVVHLGYHSNKYDPTFNFCVINHHEFTPEYLNSLSARVEKLLQDHIIEKEQHPEVERFYQLHQQFINSAFETKEK
ncbi:phytanoyl-CoA dioxygenase family protein [Francisella sp. LA112445]|uniref:phytanoyl-CoA dioxygenase family protein n=1 Tax=Francisella sp. LA112445 TaxID=1395624 RepID=UPI001788CE25|nr:phytanoyl-CoA dioxygenase family protein [Francisella sp. LA112445]QIW09835.1 phytanoyl-CoA dioxygenase family protein [Francisella sp. LA112445]